MSEKMTCPGCNAYTSGVLINVRNGEPCPHCGLSASAILEVAGVQEKQADEELKQRLEKALLEAARATAEAEKLRRVLETVRRAIGCEKPWAPHETKEPEW